MSRPDPPNTMRQALVVLRKDLRAEMRSRAAISSILLFAVTSLVVVGFAAGSVKVDTGLKAALLWVVLFFSAFAGLAHVFLHEEETGSVIALRITASPEAIFVGKLLFNEALLGAIALITTPLLAMLLGFEVANVPAFIGTVVAGCLGLGASATAVAAIIARARSRGALFGALGFPLLMPLLFMAVSATRAAMLGDAPPGLLLREVGGLASFAVLVSVASTMVFPLIWDE